MSSLMRGSSAATSTRSDLRKLPCSAGGCAVSASTRSSATGRTGWIRKMPGRVWATAAYTSKMRNGARLRRLSDIIRIIAILFNCRLRVKLNLTQVSSLQLAVYGNNIGSLQLVPTIQYRWRRARKLRQGSRLRGCECGIGAVDFAIEEGCFAIYRHQARLHGRRPEPSSGAQCRFDLLPQHGEMLG